jgi:hypothetical protein
MTSDRPIIVSGIQSVTIFTELVKIVLANSFHQFQLISLPIFLTNFYQYCDFLSSVAANLLSSGVTKNQSNECWFVYNQFMYSRE